MRTPEFIQTIVTSTRVRLARNLESYEFPERLKKKEAKEIVEIVGHEIKRAGNFKRYDMDEISAEEGNLLQEQHLISPALLKRKDFGAAFISKDKDVSIMVNEEDHLRQQCILKGFDLYGAYECVSRSFETV